MSELRTLFGMCVKAHRRRKNLTQEVLAERAGLSLDMIAKIEGGASGASFATIEQLSNVLGVDAAALFKIGADETKSNGTLNEMIARVAALSDDDIAWVSALLDAALRPRSRSSTRS